MMRFSVPQGYRRRQPPDYDWFGHQKDLSSIAYFNLLFQVVLEYAEK